MEIEMGTELFISELMRQRDDARAAAVIARENPRCPDFEPDCNVCKAHKLIDEWEKANGI